MVGDGLPPAQVLDEHDPFIPAGSEAPRRGAVPVRFFGTYEFSYIESQRALVPYDDPEDDRRDASTDQVCCTCRARIEGVGRLPPA